MLDRSSFALCVLAVLAAGGGASARADAMDDLVAAARKEGELTVIALPRDWCGYGGLIEAFSEKYGIRVNEVSPNARSTDQVDAVRASKGKATKDSPDVIDVGLSFGPSARAEGLIAPYKVSTWASIPDAAKDPDGYWYGDYFGVLAFQVNTDIVKVLPKDWTDLKDKAYRKSVALAGDPRASNQAVQSVYAAGLAMSRGDPARAAEAGLDFFAELHKNGNLVPKVGRVTSLIDGTTPIVIRWDYNALAERDVLKDDPSIEVVVPTSAVVAGLYVQAISAHAPHPSAAKLWMEYLYSDEGQLGWLRGYCHPIRFQDLVARGRIPPDMLDRLPPAAAYGSVVFPSLVDQAEAKDVITTKWDAVVGADVR